MGHDKLPFVVGDQVECIDDAPPLVLGKIYKITAIAEDGNLRFDGDTGGVESRRFSPDRFRLWASAGKQILEQHKEKVAHPSHYNFSKFEVMEVLDEWFPTNPLLWQVGKYIARADHKGNALEDLKKALFLFQREITKRELCQTK